MKKYNLNNSQIIHELKINNLLYSNLFLIHLQFYQLNAAKYK